MITTEVITLANRPLGTCCDGCHALNVPVLRLVGSDWFRWIDLCGQCLANAMSKLWKAESKLPHRDCQMPHETIEELSESYTGV